MKTSLIIPAYNEEDRIEKCLKSVFSQSFIPDEIIVCDNNSTDKTAAIVKKFAKKYPIKYVFEKQKGIKYALEKAWRSTSGDLILRTDADSVIPKDWVKNIISHFDSDHRLSACGGKPRAIDGPPLFKIATRIAIPLQDLIFYVVKGHTILIGSNFAIRRSALKHLNGYQPLNSCIPDDNLISQKLYENNYKFKRFRDCWNLTSTRRFQKNPLEALYGLLSIFKPHYYHEKDS